MKFVLIAMALAAASVSHAGTSPDLSGSSLLSVSGISSANSVTFEAAGRKGSKRVGGSGRSGKGGKYVGGRK